MKSEPWLRDGKYYSFDYLLSFNKMLKKPDGNEIFLYPFRLAIGGRGVGKTVDLQDTAHRLVLKTKDEYATWIRLKEPPIKKILQNPYMFVDEVNKKRWNLLPNDLTIDGNMVKYKSRDWIYFASLSTYHNEKSTKDFSKCKIMILDEFKKERTEKNTFDIHNALINEVETVLRERNRIILAACNTINDASDLLDIFGFEPREYGIYKLPKIGVIIHYFPDSKEFQEERPYRTSSRLASNHESARNSLFNKVTVENVTIMKPAAAFVKSFILKLDHNIYVWYGTWFDRVGFKEVDETTLRASLGDPKLNPVARERMKQQIYAWHIKYVGDGIIFDPEIVKSVKKSISSGNIAFSNKTIFNLLKRYLTNNN